MAYSSRDRVAQTEQQARAAQNNVSSYVQQRLAYQQTPPENRRPDVAQLRQYADDDFYKWVRSTYGFATKPNDIRNGYIDPSEDMVAKALSQYAYNRQRVSKQGKNPLKYGTLDYDPWNKDEADNEDWGAFVRDYERLPSDTEVQALRNQRAAKLQGVDSMSPSTAAWDWKAQYTYDQNDANDRARQKLNAAGYNVMPKALLAEYTNDPEDQRRLKAGLPPLRIERTQQIVDEVQRYKAEAQGLAESGQYTPEAAAMLRAKYPALNALQSEVEAAQESESGPTLKSMFDQTADPASRYFKTDVLAKYGYAPGSGFAFDFSNAASRDASPEAAAQITQGWKDAMSQRSAQQMPQPVVQPPQQSAVNPLTIPGGMSQLRGNEREGMGNAYQQANPQPVQQPSTLDNVLTGVSRVLNAPQALYLNAWNAAANAVQGRPVQYNPDITGAQYAAERAEAAGAPNANIPAAMASIYTNDQTKAATAKALGLPEDSAAAEAVTNIQSAGAQLPYEAATDPTTLFGLGEIAAISRGGRALQLGDAGYDAALAAGRIKPQDASPTALRELNAMEADQAAAVVQREAAEAAANRAAAEAATGDAVAVSRGLPQPKPLADFTVTPEGQALRPGQKAPLALPAGDGSINIPKPKSMTRLQVGERTFTPEKVVPEEFGMLTVDTKTGNLSPFRELVLKDIADDPTNYAGVRSYYSDVEKAVNDSISESADIIYNYPKKGVSVVSPEGMGEGYRISNNEPWYRDFYAKNGRAPNKAEARQLATEFMLDEGGQFYDPEFARNYYVYSELKPLVDSIGDNSVGAVTRNADGGYSVALQRIKRTPNATGSTRTITPAELKGLSKSGATPNTTKLSDLNAQRAAAAREAGMVSSDATANTLRNPLTPKPVQPTAYPNAGNAWGNMPVPRALREAATGSSGLPGARAGNNTGDAVQRATRAVDAPQTATQRNMAQAADDVAELTIDPKTGKPMPVGKPGQKAFDLEIEPPDGMKERGFNRNTRTDANNPDALRQAASSDPLFYEQIRDKDTLAKAQKIYDQGEAAARSELNRLNEKMAPEAVPLSKMLARDAAARGDVDTARQIMSDAAERLTSAGQYTSAARILRESDPETMFMTMDKQLKKLNTEGQKVYGKRWKDFDLLPDEIDEIGKLTPGDTGAYEAVMEKIQARVADQLPSTAMEKLTAWRHMAMLLNPKTHLRNLGGNTLMLGMNKAAEKVDAVLQTAILPKDLRTQSIRVSKEARGVAREFFESNQKDLLTQIGKYDEGLGLNMPNKRVFKNNALEGARKFNYAALQAEDKIFYRKAFTDRLASAMSAKGVKSADGITDDMVRLAKKEAEKATFQDDSAASKIASLAKKSKGGIIADTIMPFAKTPINITRRGLDFSPVGIVKGLAKPIHPIEAIRGGISKLVNKDQVAEGIGDIAKGLTGTGVIAAGYIMAEAGWLTGAADKDEDMRNYNAATGNAPFSVMGQYTYDWAQPAAIPLAVGVAIHGALQDDPRAQAKMQKAIESGDTETLKQLARSFGSALLEGALAGGDTIYKMSVMQGVSELFDDPAGFGAALMKLPANYIGQAIPTVSGQLAGAIDPTVRKTNYGSNFITDPEGYAKSTVAQLGAKIPGVSTLLEPKVTPFGEEQKRIDNPWLRALQNFASPGNIAAKQQIDPQIDTELRRLFDAGQVKQFPITVDRNFTFMDKQVRLSDTEYTRYQRVTGQETIKTIKEVLNSTEYRAMPKKELESRLKALAGERGTDIKAQRTEETIKRLTDEYRAALMAKAIVYGRAMAQVQILQERGVLGTPNPKELAKRLPGLTEADAKKLLNNR